MPVTLKLSEYLPHFTPSKSDTIVYTSVQEAQCATKLDVYKYLNELKIDLQVAKFQSLPENSTRDYWEWVHSVHSEIIRTKLVGFGPKFCYSAFLYRFLYFNMFR